MNGTKGNYPRQPEALFTDRVIRWIGSVSSLAVHTALFGVFFLLSIFGVVSWGLMLLVLTTVVSLEAIYLAIFIQMTVNRHTEELEEVSEDIDEIQEDLGEMQEDVEVIQEDDIKDATRRKEQVRALGELTKDVRRVLDDLDTFRMANGIVKKPKAPPATPPTASDAVGGVAA